MVKAISIRITILHVPEEHLEHPPGAVPDGRDWLGARKRAIEAVEAVFARLNYGRVFQVSIEQEETEADETFHPAEED